MNAASFVIIFLLFIGLLAPISYAMSLLFIMGVFGAMNIVPGEISGGNVTPGSAAALFFVVKALTSRTAFANSLRVAADFRRLGFLTVFLIVAILGAFILPRVFTGSIHVYAMRSSQLELVAPSAANYTQAIYLTVSTLVAICIAAWIRNPAFEQMLPKAILAGAWAVIITGVMDIVCNAVGLGEVLSYFRTATYVFMVDNFVEGSRRIIGLMPEASAYGGMAAAFCGLLLFLRPIYPTRLWRWQVPVAGWGCGLMALLSTSSTAYAMMAVILGLYALYGTHKVMPNGEVVRKTLLKKALAFAGAGLFAMLILVFDSDIADHFGKLINTLLFEKQKSSSYADRSRLTALAFDAFLESGGMGVGIGTARASNFFVNLLASTGVLGGGLFLVFLWVTFTRRAHDAETRANVTIRAAKLSLVPILVGATLSGTTPDFGPIVGVLFGMIGGLSQPREVKKWISPQMRKQMATEGS